MRLLRPLASTLAFSLWSMSATAEVVTYQQGDGKGSVSDTDDTTLNAPTPDTTWVGAGEDITHIEVDNSDHRHTILKFPNIFGNGANQIPQGALIVSATLTLVLDNDGTDCPIVYRLIEDWVEAEATWNSRSTGVAWSDAGADGTGSNTGVSLGTIGCTGAITAVNKTVTSSVQAWSDGDLNAGWVLVNDNNDNGINYRSSEHGTAADRPLLTVEYIPAVFYSVGTNTGDLKTGSPNITVASGIATLSVAQTNDIGVGDVIDYDVGNDLVYISGVISPTQFRVQTADGNLATPGGPFTVNSIKRAFNSIGDAVTGSTDGTHLGTSDLTALARRLTWVCYDDNAFDVSSTTTITGYTTDATRFITVTVASASQVATGNSQRHRGIAGTGVNFQASAGGIDFLSVSENYTRIEWVEFDGNDISTTHGIQLNSNADNSRVRNVLLHHLTGTVTTGSGIYIDSGNDASEVDNAIVYAYDGDGVHVSGSNAVVSNSTFYLGRTAPPSNSIQTDTGATATAYNILAVGPQTDFWENDAPGLDLHNCISTDSSAMDFDVSGSFKTGVSELTEFISSAGAINLHLRPGAEALDFGTDRSASFIDDIDDETRPLAAAWDVGADESVFTATVTNFRSIGPAPDLVNEGTITVTAGSITVTKTGGLGWSTQNRGRGDVLIVGADEYMVGGVVSNDQLLLAAPATTSYTGPNYTIARQHATFQSWYDCVDNTAVCPYFPVSTSSLVTDDRIEVGIAYDDGVYMPSAQVLFAGATTDTSHTILLTADGANRHRGVVNAGVVIDGQSADRGFRVEDSNITIEWLEFRNVRAHDSASVLIRGGTGSQTGVLLQHLLIHNFLSGGIDVKGIGVQGNGGKDVTIRNTMIWDGDYKAIEGDDVTDVVTIENVTVDDMSEYGIDAFHSSFIIYNTIVTTCLTADFFVWHIDGSMSGSHNTSSDTTAGSFFTNFQNSIGAAALFVVPNSNLHLRNGVPAVDTGVDRSPGFGVDIDFQSRPAGAGWDRGADERAATTAVELALLSAAPANGAVDLSWETASELNNLGFHVHRATAPGGIYERITSQPIPGLGSSPVGARYSYRDTDVDNGVTYYYRLEDIETTGRTELHGPVSATPASGLAESSPATADAPSARIAYGDPSANSFEILKRGSHQLVLELTTEGFYAEPQDDGSVRLVVPGLESENGEIPVKRAWVEAIAGRKVTLGAVTARRVDTFASLRPSNGDVPELVATRSGTVRARQRRRATRAAFRESAAQIISVGFQGEAKKALVELAPLRWDAASGQLVLARRLVVRVSFRERDPSEDASGRRYRKPRSHDQRSVVAQLGTTERGLHRVRYEDVLRGFGRGVASGRLRLSRQGESVAYHIVPDANLFAPGSVLYFVSEGAEANPYGPEAVYELEVGAAGTAMSVVSGVPSGAPQLEYWHQQQWEENRYYQSALVDAPDLWLWDLLLSPETKTYSLDVSGLASSEAELSVWLQGASDFEAAPDHHVRVYVNGSLVAEHSWNGKQAVRVDAGLAEGVLHDGNNRLELENVGDTPAAYSMVMLDRYALEYRRVATEDRVEGRWTEAGTAELGGFTLPVHVLDMSGDEPRWVANAPLGTDGTLRFRVESGHRYLAMSPEQPRVTFPCASRLKNTDHSADYLVIGPDAFLEAATPLLELRAGEGLKVETASIDAIYSEFGFGEPTPEAVKDFIAYAYHNWKRPSPHYVLLVGDATFDFKDVLKTGVVNHVPPRIVRTSYLWTASDPSYAAVNGEDLLPDLAIGRLPAANVDQVRAMVHKIIAYETSTAAPGGVVLVADNADEAGDFEGDADALAASILASTSPTKIYLSKLGAAGARDAILQSFDDGASMVSYMGHGGIHLWGDENFFNTGNVASLAPQEQQPLLLTMNCLNGFFHFPYFDSLAEKLLQEPGKGAIAAFSPSGLSLNEPAQRYHRALLEELLQGEHERLGDALLEAQKIYAETGAFPELLSIYHLFGDPALTLR